MPSSKPNNARALLADFFSAENLKSILLGVALALVIRTFIIQAYKIPSGSMRPTLMEGDRLLVSKFLYRFREPQRGDIIVIRYPEDRKREFIKRLVGSPGDVIGIRGGRILVNGRALDGPPFNAFEYSNRGALGDPNATVTVPPHMLFVLGDNSSSSRDSRFWGFVPRKDVIGKALLIFWPFTRWRVLR